MHLLVTDEDRRAVASSIADTAAGERPAADDRFRARDNAAEADFMRTLADEAAEHLEGKSADLILRWAAHVVPRFAITSSFGADSAVLLHLAATVAPQTPIFFLDTGYHFDETIQFRQDMARDLGLTVLDLKPDLSVTQQDERFGKDLFNSQPDACCQMRKTVPLRNALKNFDGWATGVRRVQTAERAATPVVEARLHDGRWLVKVAPLAAWSDQDITDYLEEHDLPRHPLVADGYASIGCAPCTRAVGAGENPRAGRWSDFDTKNECGIHFDDTGAVAPLLPTTG